MDRVIEIFFDQILKEICGEGERRIKLQAFSACLEAIRGVRRVFLLAYVLCFSCFLSALSFFATGYLAVEQWRSGEANWLEPRLIFCLGVWIISSSLIALTVREKKWSSAFRLQERIAELEASSRASHGYSPGFSETDLVRVINRVLDERLKPVSSATTDSQDHVA